MTVEEIFSKLNQRMIIGLMVHSQMSDYYAFLGFKGYAKCHEYHFLMESKEFRELNEYFLENYNKIISELPSENPHIIPTDWYKYTKQQVDTATRKNSLQTALKKWCDWEKETKTLYHQMHQELMLINDISGADMVNKMIKDVTEEYNYAVQKMLELKIIDFDFSVIIEEQDELYNSYTKKIKKIF